MCAQKYMACKIRCRSKVELILSFVLRVARRRRGAVSAAAKANKSRSMKPNEDNSSMTVIEVFAWLAFTFHVHLEAFFVSLDPSFGATAKNICHCDDDDMVPYSYYKNRIGYMLF